MENSYSKITHKNDHTRAEAKTELLFLESKYEKVKTKLYHKKLLGQLQLPDLDEIGNLMNIIAMKYSQEGHHKIAEDWLRRTLKHTEHSPRLAIITYNNMACVYRQSNNLPMALLYINKAQKEADLACLDNSDDTILKVVTDCSLNLCAILSSMGEHFRALKAAKKALKMVSASNVPPEYSHSLLPIVKFNQGVEYEQLRMYNEARKCYMDAIASPGVTHQLSIRINEALQTLKLIKTEDIKPRFGVRKLSLPKTMVSNRQNTITIPTVTKTARQGPCRKRRPSQKLANFWSVKESPKQNICSGLKIHRRNQSALIQLENR